MQTGKIAIGASIALSMIVVSEGFGGFAAHAADRTLRYAHIFNPEHSIQKGAQKLAEVVEAGSNGRIEIRILPSEQLGSERQVMEGLQFGSIEMAYVTGNVVEGFEPLAGILSLPYIIRDFDHAFAAEDGPIGDAIREKVLETTGVRILGYNLTGFRMLATKGREVSKLEDFAGLKVRVPESPVMVETFRALGANPTPLPWGELYTALQTGVVDAGEAPPAALDDLGLFDVATYLVETNHVYTGGYIMINEAVWQSLSAADQTVLAEGALENQKLQRQLAVASQQSTIDRLKSEGVTVVSIDTAPLREAVSPIHAQFGSKLDRPELIDELISQ